MYQLSYKVFVKKKKKKKISALNLLIFGLTIWHFDMGLTTLFVLVALYLFVFLLKYLLFFYFL